MVEKVDIKQSLVRFLDLAKTHPGEEEVLNLLAEIEKKIRRTLNPENTNIEEIDFALHLIAEGILRARAKTNVELAEILNGDELGVDAMLSYLWERLEILMKGFDPEETAKLCERLHIEYHKLKRVILIPDEIEKNEGGESKPKEEKELSVSKLKILIHLLK